MAKGQEVQKTIEPAAELYVEKVKTYILGSYIVEDEFIENVEGAMRAIFEGFHITVKGAASSFDEQSDNKKDDTVQPAKKETARGRKKKNTVQQEVDPVDPVDPVEDDEPVDPVDSVVDPVDPVEDDDPVDSVVDPVDPVDPVDSVVDPVDPIEPVEEKASSKKTRKTPFTPYMCFVKSVSGDPKYKNYPRSERMKVIAEDWKTVTKENGDMFKKCKDTADELNRENNLKRK